jgi:predicted NUDIX family NTP pyrophosphohydrolase
MKKRSAGIIVYRKTPDSIDVMLAHMGSPWWAKKDVGSWTIPKGEINDGEDAFDTAKREFVEELSLPVPDGEFIDLGAIEQHNNKTVQAWAIEADIDVSKIKSNTFKIEWPPKSGKEQEFPEIDRAGWFDLSTAAQKAVRGQAALFERLAEKLGISINKPEVEPENKQASLF